MSVSITGKKAKYYCMCYKEKEGMGSLYGKGLSKLLVFIAFN